MNAVKSNVTAIIPVYNGKRYLREAVESVIYQSVLPDRLLIIDDGSTDGSVEVLEGINSSVPITVITQPNAGQAAARNRGVALADTECIALLDQDDRWYPRHIEVMLQPLSANPKMGWVYTNCDAVGEDGKMRIRNLLDSYPVTHPKRDLRTCLSEDMFILPSASMIRKRAFEAVGGFDERFCGYEDDDLFLRLFVAGWGNEYIPESHSTWRIHDASSLHSHRMIKSRRIYAEKLMAEYPDQPENNTFFVRDCIAGRFFTTNWQQYKRGLIIGELDYCREALADMRQFAALADRGLATQYLLFILKFPAVLRIFLHGWHVGWCLIKFVCRFPMFLRRRGNRSSDNEEMPE